MSLANLTDRYREVIAPRATKPVRQGEPLEHALFMLEELPKLKAKARWGKFYRFIGMVQGILVTEELITFDDIVEDNRRFRNIGLHEVE